MSDDKDLRLELQRLAEKIYSRLSNPVTAEQLEEAYSEGMLRPEELEDGKYYLGDCRNSTIACWSARHQTFAYNRRKFGTTYTEEIEHPVHDDGFDLFVPIAQWNPEPSEIIEADFFSQKSARKGIDFILQASDPVTQEEE